MNKYKKFGGNYRNVDGSYRTTLRDDPTTNAVAFMAWYRRKYTKKYAEVLVCGFQEFAEAFYTTYHPNLQLDKDILCFNQGVSSRYYPETIWHIPEELNRYANNLFKVRSMPYGVSWSKSRNRWVVGVSHDGVQMSGYQKRHSCPVEASRLANVLKYNSGVMWVNKYPEYGQFDLFVENLYVYLEKLTDEFERTLKK